MKNKIIFWVEVCPCFRFYRETSASPVLQNWCTGHTIRGYKKHVSLYRCVCICIHPQKIVLETQTLLYLCLYHFISTLHIYIYISGQIIIFHQPRFPWNKGISLTKPPFGVRSCEVAIIWPDILYTYKIINIFHHIPPYCTSFHQIGHRQHINFPPKNGPTSQSLVRHHPETRCPPLFRPSFKLKSLENSGRRMVGWRWMVDSSTATGVEVSKARGITFSHFRGPFSLEKQDMCCTGYLSKSNPMSPSTAPAIQSDKQSSPNTALATKSDEPRSHEVSIPTRGATL